MPKIATKTFLLVCLFLIWYHLIGFMLNSRNKKIKNINFKR